MAKQITDFEGTDSLPMWHKDKVYYLSDAGDSHRLNIWEYDTKSGEREQITKFSEYDCKWPAIGPGVNGDGEIVFSNGPKLYLLDLKTNQSKAIDVSIPGDRPTLRGKSIDASKFVNGGDISPTGKRIVLEARGDIWTLPVKNGSPRNLTATSGVADRNPIWSPDGQWIAYLSDESGEYEVYVTQSDGRGETKQLTSDGDCYRYLASWSPDSKHITYSDKTGKLFLLNVESKESKLVDTDPLAEQIEPSWSHNSQWLCYSRQSSERAPISSIWVYNVQDGTKKRLTNDYFNDNDPVFDNKGEFIYFHSNRDFSSPRYEDLGTTFIYAGTDVMMAMPLRADVKHPLLPKIDEETWGDDKEDDQAGEEASESEPDKTKTGNDDEQADKDKDEKTGDEDKGDSKNKDDGKKSDADKSADEDDGKDGKKKDAEKKDADKDKPFLIEFDGIEKRAFQIPVGN
jgi:tricorn protease